MVTHLERLFASYWITGEVPSGGELRVSLGGAALTCTAHIGVMKRRSVDV
jgi:hypothetical protein